MNDLKDIINSNIVAERSFNDQFFFTPIGDIIKDAIYNDYVYFYNSTRFLFTGWIDTTDVRVIYHSDFNKPIIRTGTVKYHDSLEFIDLDLENDKDVTYLKTEVFKGASYDMYNFTVKNDNPEQPDREFKAIWKTVVEYNGETYSYSREIRFIHRV